MALYLVQHGKSFAKEIDPERGLSEEGLKEVKQMAEVAGCYQWKISKIFHSGKKRAVQTADIFASYLTPVNGVEEIEGIDPLDNVAAFSERLSAEDDIMLVGHLPFLQRLTSYLIIGSTEPAVFQFQNGGVVCLDKAQDTKKWIIKWALMPHIN